MSSSFCLLLFESISFFSSLLEGFGKGIVLILELTRPLDLDFECRVHSSLDLDHLNVAPVGQYIDNLSQFGHSDVPEAVQLEHLMSVLGENVLDDCHVPGHLESTSNGEDVAQVGVLLSGRSIRALAWSPSVAPVGSVGILLDVFGSRSAILLVTSARLAG